MDPKPIPSDHRFQDLTGKRFNRWVMLYYLGEQYWWARCDCGTEKRIDSANAKLGKTKSCGCLNQELKRARSKHGGSRLPEYKIWKAIRQRCFNPNNPAYPRYGGRKPNPITMCGGFARSFNLFLDQIGRRPLPTLTVERINNEVGYCCGTCQDCVQNGWPANCRWASRIDQARNRRSNRMITWDGRTQTMVAWAQEIGIDQDTLSYRLTHGWSLEDALITRPITYRLGKRPFPRW